MQIKLTFIKEKRTEPVKRNTGFSYLFSFCSLLLLLRPGSFFCVMKNARMPILSSCRMLQVRSQCLGKRSCRKSGAFSKAF